LFFVPESRGNLKESFMSRVTPVCPRSILRRFFLLLPILAIVLWGCDQDQQNINPDDLKSMELMVAATVPDSGELKLSQTLGFLFAGAPAPDDSTTGGPLDPAPATIVPAIEGHWNWTNNRQLSFVPEEAYEPNTRYRVTLDPSFFSSLGLKLRGTRKHDFTAQPFACQALDLNRQRIGSQPRLDVVHGFAQFNYPVDPEKFAASLSCALSDGEAVEFVVETTAVDKRMVFRTVEIEGRKQDFRLIANLDGSLLSVFGNSALGETRTSQIEIPAIERLKIRQIKVVSREESPAVKINFSSTVLPEDLLRAMTVEPEVENLRQVGSWDSVELIGQWEFGTTYHLKIAGELKAENGLALERDFASSLTITDLDPMVRIAGPGNYLSLLGDSKVGVETINLEKFTLGVDRIHANNLVPFLQKVRLTSQRDYYYNWDLSDHGTPVYQKNIPVQRGGRNKIQLTAVDLQSVLSEESRGIFRLRISDPDSRSHQDSRWIVATDLGLVAKQSAGRVEVAVASISRLEPVAGVMLQVMSYNNQVLASGRTDSEGLASFSGLSWDDAGGRPFVVVATRGQDLSFLNFDETRVRTADLDVGGVDVGEKGYRAYLYGDRDIYRPGETAHLVWVVRDSRLQPPGGFPLNLKIMGPGGQDFVNAKVACDETGTGEFSIDLPAWAMTGKYTALLFLGEDNLLGETRLSVEDFIPDRMKVAAELMAGGLSVLLVGPNDRVELEARAVTLFGPVASGRSAEASLWFRQTKVEIPGFEDFSFGENRNNSLPPRRELGQLKTDEQGLARWDVPLPEIADYQGWLKMTTLVKVTESGGGRAVSASADAVFSPTDRLIGLRNLSQAQSDYLEPGQPISFEAVMVDLQGNSVADSSANLRVLRKQWRTVLKKDGAGNFHYISEYDEKLTEERPVSLLAQPTAIEVTPGSHGSYLLVVENADGTVRGSVDFYVYGQGYSPWAMNNPEKVNLKLDRESYTDGDVVTASVEAPFPGLLLLTMEREKVFSRRWFRLNSNTGTVQVSLPLGAAPNVYLTATLLRPLDQLDPRSPARAFGAVPVFIDRAPVTLPVEVSGPDEMRPRQKMNVRVHLPRDNAPLRLTVAAVDEGILQLTNFETPSALDFFLQRRRLAVDSYDIWSLLLPEYERVLRKSAAGGDRDMARMAAPEMAKRLNPLAADRVKPVALWSGLLKGKAGWQDIGFDVPEFNGSLRVMVMAVAGDRFGTAETTVRVADPLVLSPSLPRFLAPGDRFRVPVPVYNGSPGQADQLNDVDVNLSLKGPLMAAPGETLGSTIPVGIGREEVAWFDLQADEAVGKAQVKFEASAAGETVFTETELSVRPPFALAGKIHTGSIDQARVFTRDLSSQWYPGTGITTVTVAANPVAQFGAALPYLLRYPYGCVEQITSRSFPLVYFADLAATLAPGEFSEGDADYYVNSGLDYVATLFRPGSGFAMWPGRDYGPVNAWATTYVTHFLVEAGRQGYVLPENLLQGALDVVAGFARSSDRGWPNDWTRNHRLRTRAYACYVLALATRPDRGAMDQMAHGEWDSLSPVSRTHLAGAYALTGNRERFEQLLPAVDAPVEGGRSAGFTWYSQARDEAMRLEVLATVATDHAQVPRLLQRLTARAENGRWYNTQENAFSLLALGKLSAGNQLVPASGQVLVDGEVVADFSAEGVSVQSREWAGQTLEIRATSPGSAWFTVLDEGVPRQAEHEQYDAGLVVRREYFDTSGAPVDLLEMVQGQTVVCRLLLSSDKGRIKDVVISDLVPAGLEIENPRLTREGLYDWIAREQNLRFGNLPREHLEIRDDRLLLFTSANARVSAFYYTLRAVTAGHFALPQIRAEAMYDPEVMSVGGGGEIRIVSQ
jgi:alpha-2-macroglobulin